MQNLQRPTDLDLQCLQRHGISGFSRTLVKAMTYQKCVKCWHTAHCDNCGPHRKSSHWNIGRSSKFESPHGKTIKMDVSPAKTHISLGIRRLIRVFTVRSMDGCGPNLYSSRQRRLWSDWADAKDSLSLLWAHMLFCWFCHEVAQI